MTSDQHKLRLSIAPHQYEEWCQIAASQGISVHDFIRRAVDGYNPAVNAILLDLEAKVATARDAVAAFHSQVLGIQKDVGSAHDTPP